MSRFVWSLLLVLPLLITLPSPRVATQDVGSVIDVSAIDLAFEPNEITAAPGDTIVLTNNGVLQHNIVIADAEGAPGTETIGGGETDEFIIPNDLEEGTYTLECSVPGHAEAGMVGTLTIVAPEQSSSDDSSSDSETEQSAPELDIDLGDDWDVTGESELGLAERGDDPVLATVVTVAGPASSLARIVVAEVDVANGRPTYDRWQTFVDTVGAGLIPAQDDPDIPEADGCLLQGSVQGDESLTGAQIGSTVCLTDDGRFVWASISGVWEPDGEATAYAAASVLLVEYVLGSGQFAD